MKPNKKDLHLFLPCLFHEPFFYMRVMSQQDQPVRLCNAQILLPDLFLLLPVITGLRSCALLWARSSALPWAPLLWASSSLPCSELCSALSSPALLWAGEETKTVDLRLSSLLRAARLLCRGWNCRNSRHLASRKARVGLESRKKQGWEKVEQVWW